MKIRVQREADRRIEILTLIPPVTLTLGQEMNRLTDASGMQHFFVSETGLYDGWSISAPAYLGEHKLMTEDQAEEVFARIDAAREIL